MQAVEHGHNAPGQPAIGEETEKILSCLVGQNDCLAFVYMDQILCPMPFTGEGRGSCPAAYGAAGVILCGIFYSISEKMSILLTKK